MRDFREFIETIVRLSLVASKDETRYNLMGVHLVVKNRDITLEVTDGHRAIIESFKLDESHTIPDGSYIIRTNMIKTMKEALKANKYGMTFGCEGLLLTLNTEYLIKLETIDNYVKIKPLVQDMPDNAVTIAFNAEYILSIAKALGVNKKHPSVQLTLDPNNTLQPYHIKVKDNNNAGCVLMPVRIDK